MHKSSAEDFLSCGIDAVLEIPQGTFEILPHTTRSRGGSGGGMQAITLARVLLGEGGKVAGDGAQFESRGAGRLPELERHAARILGQHLSVGGIGLAAA
jgi:hypothetical protein